MCIDSSFHQEPVDVMSTDDSDVLPDPSSRSTNLSVDTSPTAPYTLPATTMKPQETTTEANSQPMTDSSVDVETVRKGASQQSLSSLSRFDVSSLDAVSLEGEQGDRKDHANSAFEIMSVVTDLDSSNVNVRNPTSADESLRNISKGESGSEEDATSLSEASRIDSMASNANGSSAPTQDSQPHNTDSTLVIPNGAGVQPGTSRFKRVNMYERGRWTIKDMANTEESQKDPKNPQKPFQEGGSILSLLSPAISRRTNLSEFSDPLTSSSTTELPGGLSSGSGVLSEANLEKDSTSGSGVDRSSTAAESTLSRKSSLSSMVPDDHFDTESVASASGSTAGRDRDTPDQQQSTQPVSVAVTTSMSTAHTTTQPVQPQQAPIITTTSGGSTMASTAPVATAMVREETYVTGAGVVRSATQGPNEESADSPKDRETAAAKPVKEAQPLKGPASVQHAMSHLQSELNQLLRVNLDVDKQNSDLLKENNLLREENVKLKDENQKLNQEVAKLKQALAIFVKQDESASGINTASLPHGNT